MPLQQLFRGVCRDRSEEDRIVEVRLAGSMGRRASAPKAFEVGSGHLALHVGGTLGEGMVLRQQARSRGEQLAR